MKYEIIDGAIYQVEEIKTDNQTSIVKTLATNIKYDSKKGKFIEYVPEKTKEQKLEELRQIYLPQIKDAQTLGDNEEVEKLQQEYLNKKKEIEK